MDRQLRYLIAFLWLLAVILATAGIILPLGALLFFPRVSGPTAPGLGFALIFFAQVFVFSAIVLFFCLRLRPPSEFRPPWMVALSIATVAATITTLFTIANRDKYTLRVQTLDHRGQPLPGAFVECRTFGRSDRFLRMFERNVQEKLTAGTNGFVEVRVGRGRHLSLNLGKTGFESAPVLLIPAASGLASTVRDSKTEVRVAEDSSESKGQLSVTVKLRPTRERSRPPNSILGKIEVPLPHDGSETRISLGDETRKLGVGDLIIRSQTAARTTERLDPDWSVEIKMENAELHEAGRFELDAPNDGYVPVYSESHIAETPQWRSDFRREFFFRTFNQPVHGRIQVSFLAWGTVVRVEFVINPTGSREVGFTD